MFYFTEDVIQLKAWQLYLGNAFWTLFVGILLCLVVKMLGLAGIHSDALRNIIHETRNFTGAQTPEQIRGYASMVVPTENTHPHQVGVGHGHGHGSVPVHVHSNGQHSGQTIMH